MYVLKIEEIESQRVFFFEADEISYERRMTNVGEMNHKMFSQEYGTPKWLYFFGTKDGNEGDPSGYSYAFLLKCKNVIDKNVYIHDNCYFTISLNGKIVDKKNTIIHF